MQRASSAMIEKDIGFNHSGGRENRNLIFCTVLLRQRKNLLSIVPCNLTIASPDFLCAQ
jgi:hypothetical protein